MNELKEIINSFMKILNNKHNSITGWFIIILTFVTMYCINDQCRFELIVCYFVIVSLLLLTNLVLDKKNNKEKGFPNVKKRFTVKIDDELILIRKEDWKEAILYLYEIENYLNK